MAVWNVEIKKLSSSDYKITRHRIIKSIFGKNKNIKQEFIGDCTVWHEYPSGKRCGTFLESWLCDIWKKEQWEERRYE